MKNFGIEKILENKIKFIILIILLQNILIFHNHYFNDATPPWDFVGTYLAVPFHWIELLRNGHDASWVPFQGMGYPLYMNLQSGYYYLPNWIFVIFDIQYTINNAVIMQCIHILIGSLGAVTLAYVIGLKWYEALLVGFAYQTFGAFYSNAEHLDIIRGYALIPWLLAPLLTSLNHIKIDKYMLYLLPVFVLFMWTGGYIGISLAVFFVMGSTLALRILLEKKYRAYGIFVILALIIGFFMSFSFLLPSLIEKNEFIRASQHIKYDYAFITDIFSVIYKIGYPSLQHDISMQSSSISLIVFMLLIVSFYKVNNLNKLLFFVLVLSILMISGYLHQYIIQLLPQLGLSRMIMSDYRTIIGIVIIIIALQNIKKFNQRDFIITLIITLMFLTLGNYFLEINNPNYKKDLVLLAIGVFISSFALFLLSKNKILAIPLIFFAILFDFYRIHSFESKRYWSHDGGLRYINKTFGNYEDMQHSLLSKVDNNNFRESRLDEQKKPLSYQGYYNGNYMMNDYGGSMHLKQHENIRKKEELKSYALLEWTPIYGNIESINEESIEQTANFVKLEKYQTSKIIYSICTRKPTSFIENEIFWKGWEGTVVDKNGNLVQEIEPENFDGFRKWDIPKGEYQFITKFTPPYQEIATYLSLFGVLVWLFFMYYLRRKIK